MFDLAAKLKNPVDLSIGQPDFDAFDAVKQRVKQAIDAGKNRYTVTQGIPELRQRIKERYLANCPEAGGRTEVFVTAGVSGGLLLSYLSLLDPGDEILIPDPYFVIYHDLALLLGIVPRCYDTYPDFRPRAERIEEALTPRSKVILVNSPSNPTGYACAQEELNQIVELARRNNLVLIYDEIYESFCYDKPHARCFGQYEQTVILNGFSKSAGVPGWRMGYVVAPEEVVSQMLKIQQYTIVCAHSASQWAMLDAMDIDFSQVLAEYRGKRDFICDALAERYELETPGGAFYLFPKAPGGSGQRFVERCIENNLLAVPGNVFSKRDTHFRLSFSAPMATLERGVEILNRLAS